MTESRFPEPPPPAAPAPPPPGREERNARVETLPARFQALSRPARLEADVIRADPETGSVRLRTDEGEIVDLRLRGRPEQVPQEGDRVQVDLPAGKPPRTATVNPAPAAPPDTGAPAAAPRQTPPDAPRPPAPPGPEPERTAQKLPVQKPPVREQATGEQETESAPDDVPPANVRPPPAAATPIPPPRPALPAGFALNAPPAFPAAAPRAAAPSQGEPPPALPPGSILRLVPLPADAAFRPAAVLLLPEDNVPSLSVISVPAPAPFYAPAVESVFQGVRTDGQPPPLPSPAFSSLSARAADSAFPPAAPLVALVVPAAGPDGGGASSTLEKQVSAPLVIATENTGTPGYPALLFSPRAEAGAAPAPRIQGADTSPAIQALDIKIAAIAPAPPKIGAPEEPPGKPPALPAENPAGVKNGAAENPAGAKNGAAENPAGAKNGAAENPAGAKNGAAENPAGAKNGAAGNPAGAKNGAAGNPAGTENRAESPPIPTPFPAPPPAPSAFTLLHPRAFAVHMAGHVAGEIAAPPDAPAAAKSRAVLSVPSPVPGPPRLFTMPLPADALPPGAEILFTPLQEFSAAEAAQTPPPSAPGTSPGTSVLPPGGYYAPYYDFLPGTPWPALEDLAQALAQAMPQDGRAALIRATPGPASPQNLPAAALLFIAAVRAGDVGGWLGDRAVDALRRAGKGEVLERASRSFGSLARLSSEPAGQDWRALSLPLYWQDGIHKMMLYYRDGGRGGGEDGEDGAPKSTRFLFDLHVPRLGDVQIDGFHAGRRLDLIVRTGTMLSPPMQQAMRRRYADALETAGLKGDMSFQGQAARFVKIGLPGAATDATL